MQGLQKFDAVNKKKEFEQKFISLVSADPLQKEKFNTLFNDFHKVYAQYKVLNKQMDYYSECLSGINAIAFARYFDKLTDATRKKSSTLKQELEKAKTDVARFHKTYNAAMDRELCTAMLDMYMKGLDKTLRVPSVDSMMNANGNDSRKVTDYLFANSALLDATKITTILNDYDNSSAKIESDPLYVLWKQINSYYNSKVRPSFTSYDVQLNGLYKVYMKGLMDVYKDKKFFPDANSTLRITYGKVKGYTPHDGAIYKHYTTLDGVMEKENPNVDEFIVFPKMKDLYAKKDYGRYADKNGKLRVAFLGSNHTTGGNSGSPVLNANGELIGTNFDRVWEGTMSDIMYNPEICRNITLDVHYTLFVIDKYAGAGYLLNEMKIVQ